MAQAFFAFDRSGDREELYECYVNIRNPLKISEGDLVKNIIQFAYSNDYVSRKKVNIKELMGMNYWPDLLGAGGLYKEIYADLREPVEKRVWDWDKIVPPYLENLRQKGYDGINYMNEIEWADDKRYDWIAFESTQIKSVLKNEGTFDPKNPDITKSLSVDANA